MPNVSRRNEASAKPALHQYVDHALALGESLDGLGEIRVGAGVARDESAVDGQHRVRIDAEQLFHRELDRCGKLYDAEMTTGLEHSVHLAQTCIEIGKVANAEGGSYGVEGVAIIR